MYSVAPIHEEEAAQIKSNISKHAASRSDLLATLTASHQLLVSGRSAELVLGAQKNVLQGTPDFYPSVKCDQDSDLTDMQLNHGKIWLL